jgi:DNA processing protein
VASSKTPAEVIGALNDIERKHAPRTLYLRGDAALLATGPRVSVVGSRLASVAGVRRAGVLAKALARHQMIVVSGLAAGIDTAAHRAAMQAGGRTIAVLGTPLGKVYPPENAELQESIARDHLLVSQFRSDEEIALQNFPIRNRTMALLTDATVVVEAAEESGALQQGWEALRLGRLLFLLESVAEDSRLKWQRQMLDRGAQILSRANFEEWLAEIPAVTLRAGLECGSLF